MNRRVVPGNEHVIASVVYGPGDAWSNHAARLGQFTNTISPASAGTPYSGDRGYGLNGNRWTGATSYPLQHFSVPVMPISSPANPGVGLGAGVSGQPGWPSTGQSTTAAALLSTYGGSSGSGMGS
jgi:hypothetical protein